MAEQCFNNLEELEPIFFEGLCLTSINIEPYFVYGDSNFNKKEKQYLMNHIIGQYMDNVMEVLFL